MKAGVLPIRLETNRYKGVKEDLQICQICNSRVIEDDMYFLYDCPALQKGRDDFEGTKRVKWEEKSREFKLQNRKKAPE